MKKYLIWLRTEYKRAAVLLPFVFIKAVIAVIVTGMVAFCGVKVLVGNQEGPLVQIGYNAPNDQMTNLAVSYLENMSSVKSWCVLIPIDSKAGLEALEQGDIAAFLMLPEHVVDGIISGSNQPAQLYLASDNTFLGQLFEELATAGVGLLQTAQAEIYATHKLVMDFSLDVSKLEEMYQQIDDFNLNIAMNREQLFHTRTLSITGNQSTTVYYAGAFLAFYLMFLGVLWGKHLKRSITEMRICAHRLGIPVWWQLAGRIGITWLMLAVCFLPVMVFWLFPGIRHALTIAFSPGAFLLFVLSLMVTAVWLQLVSLLGDNKQVITWILVMTAIICGYSSGYFIPTSLLPDVVKRIAVYLPATYIKQTFSSLFSGMIEDFLRAVLVLSGWILVITGFCVLLVCKELFLKVGKKETEKRNSLENDNNKISDTKKSLCTILILTKRLLFEKSFMVCLLLTLLLSCLSLKLEAKSETTVYAGVYAEDEHLRKLLEDRSGVVNFILYSNEEDLKRNVVRGKVECGYVLQEGLQNEIINGNGNWSITVYEKADSTMTNVINEVIFERVFYDITSSWYEGYIANNSCFQMVRDEIGENKLRERAMEALTEKLSDGSTFSVTCYMMEGNTYATQNDSRVVTYPVWIIMISNILFCGLIGVKENYADRHIGRFPNRPVFLMALYTIMQPVCIAFAVNMMIMLLTGYPKFT
ncbi:MAG TPA: ABC transporter permease [Lachnospiraceae bacterium]|nr:ABC transporter permease [Lachnospiraceae bacterium]